MKQIITGLILFSVAVFLVLPLLPVAAQGGPTSSCTLRRAITLKGMAAGGGDLTCSQNAVVSEASASNCTDNTAAATNWGAFCLINTLNSAVDWIFVILISIVVLFVIIGAITLLISAGDPGKVTSGRNYIMFAAIGLVVAFLARAVPAIVQAIMGF